MAVLADLPKVRECSSEELSVPKISWHAHFKAAALRQKAMEFVLPNMQAIYVQLRIFGICLVGL